MWPDRVSNPGPPTYESGALPIALRGPAPTAIPKNCRTPLFYLLPQTTSNEGFGNIPLIFNEYHHAGRTTRGRIYGHNHPHYLWGLSYT